jgi:REP element-mobilizing transposase RayT
MRLRRGLGSLSTPRAFAAISTAIAAASSEVFRVLQFTVQDNHLHLMIEAEGRTELMAGAKGLAVRSARALNRRLRRNGQVWGDRYHTRDLTTPSEVRNCYAYILLNSRKHRPGSAGFDVCSSARWFDGWKDTAGLGNAEVPLGGEGPVARARTWLARVGWRRRGLIDPEGQPGTGPPLPAGWTPGDLTDGRNGGAAVGSQ